MIDFTIGSIDCLHSNVSLNSCPVVNGKTIFFKFTFTISIINLSLIITRIIERLTRDSAMKLVSRKKRVTVHYGKYIKRGSRKNT